MNKNNLVRAFFGLAIVVLGGILLLQGLGIADFDYWHIFWGVFWGGLLIVAGLTAIFSGGHWIWGAFLTAGGVSVALNLFGFVDASFWRIFWSLILIVVGLAVAFRVNIFGRRPSRKAGKNREAGDKTAIFYGEEARVNGDYDGGSLTAVFGGVELDLRKAKIKDGAIIDVFTFCGGIEIAMPSDVIVKNEVRGFLGGAEDKTLPKENAKKTVILRGECVLGGLEVK